MNTVKTIKIFLKLKKEEILEVIKHSFTFRVIIGYLMWMTIMISGGNSHNPIIVLIAKITGALSLIAIALVLFAAACFSIYEFCKWIRNNWQTAKRMANKEN